MISGETFMDRLADQYVWELYDPVALQEHPWKLWLIAPVWTERTWQACPADEFDIERGRMCW